MRIELASLERNKGGFAREYAPEELDFKDDRVRLIGALGASGRILRDGKRVRLNGKLTAQTEVDCDRCLSPVAFPVAADFALQYVTAGDYEATHAAELEDDEMELSIFDGEAIDLDELVREQILLAVPDRLLCGENCKGICPVCGANQNLKNCGCQAAEIDPRWAALKEMVNGK